MFLCRKRRSVQIRLQLSQASRKLMPVLIRHRPGVPAGVSMCQRGTQAGSLQAVSSFFRRSGALTRRGGIPKMLRLSAELGILRTYTISSSLGLWARISTPSSLMIRQSSMRTPNLPGR